MTTNLELNSKLVGDDGVHFKFQRNQKGFQRVRTDMTSETKKPAEAGKGARYSAMNPFALSAAMSASFAGPHTVPVLLTM